MNVLAQQRGCEKMTSSERRGGASDAAPASGFAPAALATTTGCGRGERPCSSGAPARSSARSSTKQPALTRKTPLNGVGSMLLFAGGHFIGCLCLPIYWAIYVLAEGSDVSGSAHGMAAGYTGLCWSMATRSKYRSNHQSNSGRKSQAPVAGVAARGMVSM